MTPTVLILRRPTNHDQHARNYLKTLPGWDDIDTTHHPDITTYNQDGSGLKIKEVREIKKTSSYQPFQHQRKALVLCCLETASLPAQQALLKTLEEPPPKTDIIITTTDYNSLLPTIQSRCLVVDDTLEQPTTKATPELDGDQLYTKLTTASLGEAIDAAAEYKDRAAALAMLDALQGYMHTTLENNPTQKLVRDISVTTETRLALTQNGNVKLALEQCFFALRT